MVLDADTLYGVRYAALAECTSGPCPFSPYDPMALTIDGSHAFVSNPENDVLDYVYIQPPRLVVTAEALENVIAAVPRSEGARASVLGATASRKR